MIKSIIIRRPFYNGKQKEGSLQTQTDDRRNTDAGQHIFKDLIVRII
jgi:hypothetical protein